MVFSYKLLLPLCLNGSIIRRTVKYIKRKEKKNIDKYVI